MSAWHPSASTRHKMTLPERIDAAIEAHGGAMTIPQLEGVLWPDPKSHRYQSNGGPPGCRMALSAGLRRGGFNVTGPVEKRTVQPRKRITKETDHAR